METQTRLSSHNKFISVENIIGIVSVSSDDSRGVRVTNVGNGYDSQNSNPGRGCLHFT